MGIQTTKAKHSIISISISGYKSISKEIEIRLAPLTVLSGVNSSGKSSFFQPLLLLKQTVEAAYDPQGVLLNGPNIRIHDAETIFSKKSKLITIGFRFSDGSRLVNSYGRTDSASFDVLNVDVDEGQRSYSMYQGITNGSLAKLFDGEGNNPEASAFLKFIKNMPEQNKLKWSLRSLHGFLDLSLGLSSTTRKKVSGVFRVGFGYTKLVDQSKSFLNFLHIPGIRGNPSRNYNLTASSGRYHGRFEDYTASIIYNWQKSKSAKERSKLKELQNLLIHLGLTSSVEASKINDAFVSLNVGLLPVVNSQSQGKTVNIADVGFGVAQTLPILVSLIEANVGQTIYIEQPELHLHPRAQMLLAEALALYSKKGRRIIIETHSAVMLRMIQLQVAKKVISSDNVSLNWFAMGTDGATCVTSAKIDSKGRYGPWPQDFDDISLDLDADYIKASIR